MRNGSERLVYPRNISLLPFPYGQKEYRDRYYRVVNIVFCTISESNASKAILIVAEMVPFYEMRSSLLSDNSQDHLQQRKSDLVSDYLPFVSSLSNDRFLDKGFKQPRTLLLPGNAAHNHTLLSSGLTSSAAKHTTVATVPESYIDKLPLEILLEVFDQLTQYDVLALIKTSRRFFAVAVRRLYHTIVIDRSYSHLNKETLALNDITPFNASFVKMKYSLKRFFKSLSEPLPASSISSGTTSDTPTYGSLINKVQFIELPDGFNSPFEINFFSFVSVKQLSQLKHFLWDSEDMIPFDAVERLPNKEYLSTLHLNVDLRKTINQDDFHAFRNFNNLEKLIISPFLNSYNLFQIFKNILDTSSLHTLKVLKLARVNSDFNYVKNMSTTLLVLTDHMLEHEPVKLSDFDINSILNLFILFSAADSCLKGLTTLSIDSITLLTVDAKRLSSFVALENITHLELKNVTELQFPEGVFAPLSMQELYGRLDGGFLRILAKRLKSLKSLSIDYRESLRDTVPQFISTLEHLEELDVTIRWNITKICSVSSWKDLCKQYIRAILKHSTTLKKLSIDTKEDSVFCELHKLIDTEYLLELHQLTLLESLRLHGYSLQPYAPTLALSLRNLKYYELFGSGASGAPHMGLQAAHDGVLDDWLRVQHIANAIAQKNPGIKFIKLERCIFEVISANKVIPREGLERTFNPKTRVTLR